MVYLYRAATASIHLLLEGVRLNVLILVLQFQFVLGCASKVNFHWTKQLNLQAGQVYDSLWPSVSLFVCVVFFEAQIS